MVLLEHFDHLTKAIDCQGDDGQMSLTFNSQKAFDHAVEAWDHVNDNADGKFLLIANHPGCGPEEERQGYMWVFSVASTRKATETRLQDKLNQRGSLHSHDVLSCRKSPMV